VNVTLLVGEDDPDPEEMSFEGVCTSVRRRPRPSPFIVTSDLQRSAFASNPGDVEEYGIILDNRSFTYVYFWYFLSFMWLPWPVVYSELRDRTPVRYADVRQFMLEYESLLADGATVEVEIEGWEIASGESLTVSGPIVDVERVTEMPRSVESRLLELTGTATLVVEGDDGVYTVGGWSAIHEDVEARRITVTDVRPTDGADPEPAEDD
jgi:hypothetical protein